MFDQLLVVRAGSGGIVTTRWYWVASAVARACVCVCLKNSLATATLRLSLFNFTLFSAKLYFSCSCNQYYFVVFPYLFRLLWLLSLCFIRTCIRICVYVYVCLCFAWAYKWNGLMEFNCWLLVQQRIWCDLLTHTKLERVYVCVYMLFCWRN